MAGKPDSPELPVLFVIISKDCVLCSEMLKIIKRVPNPVIMISAELMGMVRDGNEQPMLDTLKVVQMEWSKFKVHDNIKGEPVRNPVPFVHDIVSNESYEGYDALSRIVDIVRKINPEEVPTPERMEYLLREFKKRKKVTKSN